MSDVSLKKVLALQSVLDRLNKEVEYEEEKYNKLKYAIENITTTSNISAPSLALMKEQLIIMDKFVKILKQRQLQLQDEITQLEKESK